MPKVAYGLLALGLTGAVLGATSASASPGGRATISIAAKTELAPVTGDIYVLYRVRGMDQAKVSGVVTSAVNGEVVRLYAKQFPFTSGWEQVGKTVNVTPTHTANPTYHYSFTVTPGIATEYRASIWQGPNFLEPINYSPVKTVYIVLAPAGSTQKCTRPVCHEAITLTTLVPASALATETAKKWYGYFGLHLVKRGKASPPRWLYRGAGNVKFGPVQQVSAVEFTVTVTLSFRIGNDAYVWTLGACTKDSETVDGVNLPGRHHCGDAKVVAGSYLG